MSPLLYVAPRKCRPFWGFTMGGDICEFLLYIRTLSSISYLSYYIQTELLQLTCWGRL